MNGKTNMRIGNVTFEWLENGTYQITVKEPGIRVGFTKVGAREATSRLSREQVIALATYMAAVAA